MVSKLTGSQRATYDSIFRHPVSHNLDWRSVIAVFKQLGQVEVEANGKLKFTRNGHTITLHANDEDADVNEVLQIRHFLETSEEPAKQPSATDSAKDLIVVLDHHGARIIDAGDSSSAPIHLAPYDPSGHDQQVHNPRGDSGGKQGPARKQFYESIAAKLVGADHILMVGDGQGASSEVEHLIAELATHHHKDIEKRIIGREVADLHHLTEPELFVKARELFSNRLALIADAV